MKRLILSLAILLCAVSIDAYAAGPSGIKIMDWSVQSVRPTSFSSVDGVVRLKLSNAGQAIYFSKISGVIYTKSGEKYLTGTADDFRIPASSSEISITGHCAVATGLFTFLGNISFDPAKYTADIKLNMRVGAKGKDTTIVKKGVPLSSLLHK